MPWLPVLPLPWLVLAGPAARTPRRRVRARQLVPSIQGLSRTDVHSRPMRAMAAAKPSLGTARGHWWTMPRQQSRIACRAGRAEIFPTDRSRLCVMCVFETPARVPKPPRCDKSCEAAAFVRHGRLGLHGELGGLPYPRRVRCNRQLHPLPCTNQNHWN